MKQGAFKNFVLFKPRTQYVCKKCSHSHKVFGDTWLEVLKSIRAVDAKKAFRIFWLCHNGHRQFRGYSRPVSWKKNLGGDTVASDEKDYASEDDAIEQEYREMVEYAARRSRNAH